MQLYSIGYKEDAELTGEWSLEPFAIRDINLIVGRNSTGKTRALNVIAALSRLISSGEATTDGRFKAEFTHENRKWAYELEIAQNLVLTERLSRDGSILIDRSHGLIWTEDTKKHTRFKMRQNQIAANAKLDFIQTPYLEPLNNWANSVFHFHFGSPLGQNVAATWFPGPAPEVNLKDENQTAQIYRHAYDTYGDAFDNAVVQDMRALGYEISRVDLAPLSNFKSVSGHTPTVYGLAVLENYVGHIEQHAMSTGMFRALAIIIHVNLGAFSQHAELILLDDIGEGLDFERSTKLIRILMDKVKGSNTQLIMTSNDRFIMNAVDIEYWTVLNRRGKNVSAFNRDSHSEIFEEFKFSGLQNFDFFSMNFATEPDARTD